jgi:hypothetical protein
MCAADGVKNTQKVLTETREKEIWEEIMEGGDVATQVRMWSAATPASYAWMTFPSTERILQVRDDVAKSSMRFRVGLVPIHQYGWCGDIPKSCTCTLPEGVKQYDHALLCPRARGDAKRQRHDAIKMALYDHIRQLTVFVTPEPPSYNRAGGAKRPDMSVSMPAKRWALEVTVTHPQCAHARAKAATSQGYAAKLRVTEKHRKYDAMCSANADTLYVLAVETYGLIHEEFKSFMDDLKAHLTREKFNFKRWRREAVVIVSATLQLGNYLMWKRYLEQADSEVMGAALAASAEAAAG